MVGIALAKDVFHCVDGDAPVGGRKTDTHYEKGEERIEVAAGKVPN